MNDINLADITQDPGKTAAEVRAEQERIMEQLKFSQEQGWRLQKIKCVLGDHMKNSRHVGSEFFIYYKDFFWSSGIMECTCMLFTFENGVPLMRQLCGITHYY